ncbi:MAG: D-aminoacyl-tRNA deacylase [Saprospiraceae bacterium]|nr:D-aminoacyl-tRNA deacylase [Saprospiraceae bacterium]
MRCVIQRVDHATMTVENEIWSEIGRGLLVLVGYEPEDSTEDVQWCVDKIIKMRIFPDSDGKMNTSVNEVDGEVMIVSQFTLHASIKKGNRPSYIRAASPETAIPLYEETIDYARDQLGKEKVKTGKFGAHMDITFNNNGPVTIVMDSKRKE